MNYTIEQKAVALLEEKLWWRLPALTDGSEEWSLIHGDFVRVVRRDIERSDAEYHIGDKPPKVLSDLERELLAALEAAKQATKEAGKLLHFVFTDHGIAVIDNNEGCYVPVESAADRMDVATDIINAAIAKAKGEA